MDVWVRWVWGFRRTQMDGISLISIFSSTSSLLPLFLPSQTSLVLFRIPPWDHTIDVFLVSEALRISKTFLIQYAKHSVHTCRMKHWDSNSLTRCASSTLHMPKCIGRLLHLWETLVKWLLREKLSGDEDGRRCFISRRNIDHSKNNKLPRYQDMNDSCGHIIH